MTRADFLAKNRHIKNTMLSTTTRKRLENILARMSAREEVSLEERIYLQKFADRDQTVATWLSKAKKAQQEFKPKDAIDQLLDGLQLGFSDPEEDFKKGEDDLGDWFSGAPSWLGRS